MDSCMDKASSYGRVVSSTRDPLWTMQLQVSVSTNGLMEAGIRASYWTEKDTRKASTTVKRTSLNTTVSGNMESDMGMATLSSTNKLPTKANSAKVSGTERAKWNTHQATYTKANGKMTRNAVTGLWTGLHKIKNTKESGLKTSNMGSEHTTGSTARLSTRSLKTFTKVTGCTENDKGLVVSFTRMDAGMKGTLRKIKRMAKGSWWMRTGMWSWSILRRTSLHTPFHKVTLLC